MTEGVDPGDFENALMTDFNRVSSDYFRTLRIPVLEGRSFLESDGYGPCGDPGSGTKGRLSPSG